MRMLPLIAAIMRNTFYCVCEMGMVLAIVMILKEVKDNVACQCLDNQSERGNRT
jgi:hypothetical protein